MDLFLLFAAIAFGIGALASHLGDFGKLLNWVSAGLCFGTLSFIFSVKV